MLMVEAPMGLPASVVEGAIGAVPGGLPKPPAHPPAEPIIIKVPPRPHEEPEVDRPDEGEDDDGIRRAPWMPDMPPPLPPEERPYQALRADRSILACGLIRWWSRAYLSPDAGTCPQFAGQG